MQEANHKESYMHDLRQALRLLYPRHTLHYGAKALKASRSAIHNLLYGYPRFVSMKTLQRWDSEIQALLDADQRVEQIAAMSARLRDRTAGAGEHSDVPNNCSYRSKDITRDEQTAAS